MRALEGELSAGAAAPSPSSSVLRGVNRRTSLGSAHVPRRARPAPAFRRRLRDRVRRQPARVDGRVPHRPDAAQPQNVGGRRDAPAV
ncbi:hypothetical protein NUW54_g12142 [Trametes sanguinea]|uniref:Uncharacterized protein n=1 Tax=Trametes sanguinea TaxID=158606 RepID=A0ACC1N2G0_9APHY|nr:hypothetical protein NUW54_g12142 [Trametes sanguinea]